MSLFQKIKEHYVNIPDNIAIKGEFETITYAELYHIIWRNYHHIKKYGIQSDQIFILNTKDQMDFMIVALSYFAAECWIVPMSESCIFEEIKKVSDYTGAQIIDKELYGLLTDRTVVGTEIEIDLPRDDKAGILHLTSGSTGHPKLCIRDIACLYMEGLSYQRTFNIEGNYVIASVAPLEHSYASGAAFIAGITAGCCITTIDSFVPRKILAKIERENINVLILVPAMARMLANIFLNQKYDLYSLKTVLVGAGKITKEIYDMFLKQFGIALSSNYGSTETGGLVSRLEPEPFESIGKAMYGVELLLLDDKKQPVRNGDVGEVWVRSKGMFKGYWDEEKSSFGENGFFPMGDLAYMDDRGYIYLKGRKKNIINVGGKKVNPVEVEEVILGIEGVQECVVKGYSCSSGEEIVKAYIIANNTDESHIRNVCRKHLSSYKIPKQFIFLDQFVKNEIGKIII